ncbi:MAG: vitamin B12 dependent-methionine synthase activation domain-containing protein [Paludibacter sp.]|nr:vitamin B12 dependent-methionine synthase activation domain-containing protein [Paludibacter sp.]
MNETPKHIGLIEFKDINLNEIAPFIHWSFFFLAWRISGKYEGIETVCDCASCITGWLQKIPESERAKAEEAIKLYRDAQAMLREFREKKVLTINASVGIYPAYAKDDDIFVIHDEKEVCIPTLRQQQPASDGYCYALADFIKPADDYLGVFATTVLGVETFAAGYEKDNDDYSSILAKTLSDRIAEATAEWLHYEVRTKYWGYAPDEKKDIGEMYKVHYQGIRPAVGYPSLPDQSIIFELDPLIKFNNIGIQLTENGAMFPNASVCGIYFAHPKSKYFMIGKIDDNQLNNYAERRGKSPEVIRKWLASNL